jgi:CSLREA domain-containing protein
MDRRRTITLFILIMTGFLLLTSCRRSAASYFNWTRLTYPPTSTATETITPPATETMTVTLVKSTDTKIPTFVAPTLIPSSTPTKTMTVTVTPGIPENYTLQSGEYPYCIARRFNVSITELLALNNISEGEYVPPGTTLKIPQNGTPFPYTRALHAHTDSTTYTVKAGDTFYSIACYYGDIDPTALAAANNMSVSDKLTAGQTLRIPTITVVTGTPGTTTVTVTSTITKTSGPTSTKTLTKTTGSTSTTGPTTTSAPTGTTAPSATTARTNTSAPTATTGATGTTAATSTSGPTSTVGPTGTTAPTTIPSATIPSAATFTSAPTTTSQPSSTPFSGYTVNSNDDAVDANPGDGTCASGSGACTLRAAIMEANAHPGPDQIFLPMGNYGLTLAGAGEDGCATGDLDILDSLTLTGAGSGITIIDAGRLDQVFNVRKPQSSASFSAFISGVTIQNGLSGGIGVEGGNLSLYNSIVTGNTGTGIGSNSGTVTIVNSTISGNSVGGSTPSVGGVTAQGYLTLYQTTVKNNSVTKGTGGVVANAGLYMEGSTISGNVSAGGTGGVYIVSGAVIQNSTISSNTGSDVGGIYATQADIASTTIVANAASGLSFGSAGGLYASGAGAVRLKNTILSGNISNFGKPECYGPITSQGYNMFGNTTGCSLTTATGDWVSTSPMVAALQDNGGPTYTHALLSGSPAINAGNTSGCTDANGNLLTTDQRGNPRSQGGRCDIGAYETP